MQALLGFSALVLNVIGYIPYIRDIFRKKVKPHPYTWVIWTILTTILAFNQIINGGGYSSLFFISTAILVGFVFILSLHFGMGDTSKIDRICLILASILLFYWLTTHDTRISTIYAVIIDGIGAVPTLIKTYNHPTSETYIQWVLSSLAGLLTLLSVPMSDWILLIYPFYVFLMDGAIVSIKYFRER
ncbi:MAG TPA: hypothetical protein VND99_05255 [Candidatus Acidoferrales bacterium]|nr:hypothetical protein [Candidatus Acidoferrales bacterium]